MLLTITFIYTLTSQHVPPGAADGTSCANGTPYNVTLKALQAQQMLHGIPDRVDQVPGQRIGVSQLKPHYHSNLSKCNRSSQMWQQAVGMAKVVLTAQCSVSWDGKYYHHRA